MALVFVYLSSVAIKEYILIFDLQGTTSDITASREHLRFGWIELFMSRCDMMQHHSCPLALKEMSSSLSCYVHQHLWKWMSVCVCIRACLITCVRACVRVCRGMGFVKLFKQLAHKHFNNWPVYKGHIPKHIFLFAHSVRLLKNCRKCCRC